MNRCYPCPPNSKPDNVFVFAHFDVVEAEANTVEDPRLRRQLGTLTSIVNSEAEDENDDER
jgi:hypothetical protein